VTSYIHALPPALLLALLSNPESLLLLLAVVKVVAAESGLSKMLLLLLLLPININFANELPRGMVWSSWSSFGVVIVWLVVSLSGSKLWRLDNNLPNFGSSWSSARCCCRCVCCCFCCCCSSGSSCSWGITSWAAISSLSSDCSW